METHLSNFVSSSYISIATVVPVHQNLHELHEIQCKMSKRPRSNILKVTWHVRKQYAVISTPVLCINSTISWSHWHAGFSETKWKEKGAFFYSNDTWSKASLCHSLTNPELHKQRESSKHTHGTLLERILILLLSKWQQLLKWHCVLQQNNILRERPSPSKCSLSIFCTIFLASRALSLLSVCNFGPRDMLKMQPQKTLFIFLLGDKQCFYFYRGLELFGVALGGQQMIWCFLTSLDLSSGEYEEVIAQQINLKTVRDFGQS